MKEPKKKLLVVETASLANELADLFPDFKIIGMGSALAGQGFDEIVVACPITDKSETVQEMKMAWIRHLPTKFNIAGQSKIKYTSWST